MVTRRQKTKLLIDLTYLITSTKKKHKRRWKHADLIDIRIIVVYLQFSSTSTALLSPYNKLITNSTQWHNQHDDPIHY